MCLLTPNENGRVRWPRTGLKFAPSTRVISSSPTVRRLPLMFLFACLLALPQLASAGSARSGKVPRTRKKTRTSPPVARRQTSPSFSSLTHRGRQQESSFKVARKSRRAKSKPVRRKKTARNSSQSRTARSKAHSAILGRATSIGFTAVEALKNGFVDSDNVHHELWPALAAAIEKRMNEGKAIDLSLFEEVRGLPHHAKTALFSGIVGPLQEKGLVQNFRVGGPRRKLPGQSKNVKLQRVKRSKNMRSELSNHPHVKQRVERALEEFLPGTGGSHLLEGTAEIHSEARRLISDWTGSDASLLFSTGEHARIGWVRAVADKGDIILYDQHTNLSLMAELGAGRPMELGSDSSIWRTDSFARNDFRGLTKKVRRLRKEHPNQNIFITLPSISEVDKSLANLGLLGELLKIPNVYAVVDESGALGQYGKNGAGLLSAMKVAVSERLYAVASMNQNLGADSGFLVGSVNNVHSASFRAKHHMYSAAQSPSDAAAAIGMIEVLRGSGRQLPVPKLKSTAIGVYRGPQGREVTWRSQDKKGLIRGIRTGNSYHSMETEPTSIAMARSAVQKYGAAPRGEVGVHSKLKKEIAEFVGAESVTLFATGFSANAATVRYLAEKGDRVFFDEQSHASLQVELGRAKSMGYSARSFLHNDVGSLRKKLKSFVDNPRNKGKRAIIAAESIYSMGGDLAPIMEMVALLEEFPQTMLVIDDAHGVGVLDKKGRGVLQHFGLNNSKYKGRVVWTGTLSKTFGSKGGAIAGSKKLIESIDRKRKQVGDTDSVSIANAGAARGAIAVLNAQGEARVAQFHKNIKYFRKLAKQELGVEVSQKDPGPILPLPVASASDLFGPIIPGKGAKMKDWVMGGLRALDLRRYRVSNLLKIQKKMNARKFFVSTAPKGTAPTDIVRVSVSADMTFSQIEAFVAALKPVFLYQDRKTK